MGITFNGVQIHSTNSFSSMERDVGVVWLAVQDPTWYVLFSRPCLAPITHSFARPVTDPEVPDGSHWRLDLGGWPIPLPRHQITGPLPSAPLPAWIGEFLSPPPG